MNIALGWASRFPMKILFSPVLIRRAFVFMCSLIALCAGLAAEEKSPAVFTSGADLRLRDEYSNGISTLSTVAPLHEQNYLRFRARAWGAWTIKQDASLHFRLAAEPRYWTGTSAAKTFSGWSGWEERFALFDELNFQWQTSVAGWPVRFTIGRQELKFGEAGNAWLINDGTPGDGSWTAYFDAARATVKLETLRTTLDVVLIDQASDTDDRLPTLGRSEAYAMTEQDEQGVAMYASNRSLAAVQLDAFFIHKKNRRVLANGNDARLSTLGFRAGGDLSPNWQYSVEAAFQGGSKHDGTVKIPVVVSARRDVRAWGANSRLSWLARDAHEQRVSLIGEYMSGDDPSTTGRDEMFDVLWGRCPRFSDIVATGFGVENAATYQAANLVRIGPEWSIAPTKKTSLTVGWQTLLALEKMPTRATRRTAFSNEGHQRGEYFRIAWKQRFTGRVSGLLMGEVLKQGDFYTRRDTLTFVRAEVAVTF
jgi:hypothetical protein